MMVVEKNRFNKFNDAVMSLKVDLGLTKKISDVFMKQSLEDGNQEMLALAFLLEGNVRFYRGEYEDANHSYDQCEALLPYMTNQYYLGYYHKSIGDMYIKKDEIVQALSHYYDALEATLGLVDIFDISKVVQGNIGYIYMELEVYDKAFGYYQKVVEMSEASQDETYMSMTYTKIGFCMLRTGRRREAMNYLDLGREFAVKHKQGFEVNYSLYIYGLFYSHMEDYEKAERVLNRSRDYFDEVEDDFWLSRVMAELGHVYTNQTKYDEAEEILLDCYQLIDSKTYRSVELRVLKLLGTLYEVMKDYKKSLYYYKRFYVLKETYDRYWKNIKIQSIVTQKKHEEDNIAIKALQQDKSVLESLSAIGRQISMSLDFNAIIEAVRNNLFDVISGDLLIVGIRQGLHIKYKVFGYNFSDENKVRLDDLKSPIARFMRHNEITIFEGLNDKPPLAEDYVLKKEYLHNLNHILSNPLQCQGHQVGTVVIGRYGNVGFNKRDEELLGLLSTYISVAIQNWIQSDELKHNNLQLKELTEKDGLTGAYNRYALSMHMKQLDSEMRNSHISRSVVMIDIDFFKEYNDLYGHQEGDQVLKTVSGIVRSRIIGYDAKAYRYGGDEFMLIVNNRREEDVLKLCEEVREGIIRQHISHARSKVNKYLTLTIGAATANRGKYSIDELISFADSALYQAKRRGRNNTQQMTKE